MHASMQSIHPAMHSSTAAKLRKKQGKEEEKKQDEKSLKQEIETGKTGQLPKMIKTQQKRKREKAEQTAVMTNKDIRNNTKPSTQKPKRPKTNQE
eukprot:gnl/MRDRNA2_/MRDRNA2_375314_c0_seq1.p2 gnl/MRDRNA2_/MRDRNA2_375314_c0~~gnl/MRDRNA2_/MRDRNA2_375314_c0_seq1.p2  ORF type:complete len:107 (+),score=20.28 gnl/MRDRNA2_/MRDRNA2_375314_c0_seq1:37-321(+)